MSGRRENVARLVSRDAERSVQRTLRCASRLTEFAYFLRPYPAVMQS